MLCSDQSFHKQQQLQHQQFQQQMEEKLQLLQQQQLIFQLPSDLPPDTDFLEAAHTRSESSTHSSPNVTPRASNHSNVSQSEIGHSANEHEEAGQGCPQNDNHNNYCHFKFAKWLTFAFFSFQRKHPTLSELETSLSTPEMY